MKTLLCVIAAIIVMVVWYFADDSEDQEIWQKYLRIIDNSAKNTQALYINVVGVVI